MPDKATGRPKKNVKLRYDEKGMFWFNLETKEKQNPSMPGWAQRSGGEIDFNRFIKTWNNAMSKLLDEGELTRKRSHAK